VQKIKCPKCARTLKVGEQLGGKRAKCPACGQVLVVPSFVSTAPDSSVQSQDNQLCAETHIVCASVVQPLQGQANPVAPQVLSAEPAKTREQAREEMKHISAEYFKRIGRFDLTLGCVAIVIILTGIAVCIAYSWLLGILGGVGVLALMVFVDSRLKAPHNERAKQCVATLEQNYALTHEESFELLLSNQGSSTTQASTELKAFVTQVWGQTAIDKVQKDEARRKKQQEVAAWVRGCPKCGSTSLISEKGGLEKAGGYVAGAAVGALIGTVLGLGPLAGQASTYAGAKEGSSGPGSYLRCQNCGHKWKDEKRG
jgi:DNA-directed RNA polymerase subunit RPC12/RpoP